MSLVSIPFTYSAGAVIIASQHNSCNSVIYSDHNGNIDNSNIAPAAAIVYTKLNLSGSIVNSDIATGAAIADTKLATISTASKVSGASLTTLPSTPSGAGVLPIANIATGIPTGSLFVRDDGTLQPVIPTYMAGSYLIALYPGIVGQHQMSFTKVIEMYVPGNGTLRITFFMITSVHNAHARIYRNGVAVGTDQTVDGDVTEDIAGWTAGDLLQIYHYNGDGSTSNSSVGGVRVYSTTPARETFNLGLGFGSLPSTTWVGWAIPTNAMIGALGKIGDLYINEGAGTLYTKTGTTTWT